MIQPVIHDYLTQIFVKHYKMQPQPAAQEALRFLEICELYDMQLIMGKWVVPEKVTVTLSRFDQMIQDYKDWEARRPWLPPELEN